jgi:TIR domain
MKVFLSYSKDDGEVAKALATRLTVAGLELWDPAEALFPGDNWALRIGQALQESDAMIVLVSPNSMKSEAVRQEIEYALGSARYKGRLLPVIIKPAKEMPWILKRFPAVRIGPDFEEAVRQIAEHIKHGFELAPANT